MKRIVQLLAVAAVSIASFAAPAAVIGTYDFATESSVPSAANATFTSFARQNVNAATSAGTFTSSAWTTTTSQNTSEYVSFTIQPASGYELNLQSLSFSVFRSGNSQGTSSGSGPLNGLVEVFDGAISKGTATFTPGTTAATVSFNFTDFTSQGTVTFRFYGWNAKDTSGTLTFDDVALSGTVSELNPVPEPVNIALIAFALGGTGIYAGRRWLRRK